MRYLVVFAILVSRCSDCQAQTPPPPGKLIHLKIETTLVPNPAAVDVLLPPGYEQFSKPVPVFIWLHGGTSGKDFLGNRMRSYGPRFPGGAEARRLGHQLFRRRCLVGSKCKIRQPSGQSLLAKHPPSDYGHRSSQDVARIRPSTPN